MNVENILKVADAIENHEIADLGFNMAVIKAPSRNEVPDMSGHDCGTVACIAGWTHTLFPAHSGDAGFSLGLADDVAESLFLPSGWLSNTITPQKAAKVLRNLTETGVVNWDV